MVTSVVGWTQFFSTAWLPHCFLFPLELGDIDRGSDLVKRNGKIRACWGCLWDTVVGIPAWSLGNDHSLWIFSLRKINCCLLPTKSKKDLYWERFWIWENKMPLSYTWGKDHLKSLISSLLWLQSSRAAQFVDQIPILVQENHLPHSFLKTDAVKSLAKITACSCCSLHREAHIFTSFSYRGSLFPPCPWCSGLLRDWRNCPTWGGEGRALEIQLFHNPLHSVVSCSALKCGSIMLCLILPENSVASVYSKYA